MALVNNVALITGGASGIGLATAKVFLAEGIKAIALVDLNEPSEIQVLREKNPDAVVYYFNADVSSEEQVRSTFEKTIEKFTELHIVVHCAGIINDNNWRKEFQTNMNSSVIVNLVAQEVMGKDKGGSGGTVINIASAAGLFITGSIPLYSATKSALITMSRCFGTDLFFTNTGVKVMAICPGYTKTNMSNASGNANNFVAFDFVRQYIANLKTPTYQSPESVGKCIIKAIIDGENGSVWLSTVDLPGQKMILTVAPADKP